MDQIENHLQLNKAKFEIEKDSTFHLYFDLKQQQYLFKFLTPSLPEVFEDPQEYDKQ